MWDNPRLLNLAAGFLVGLAVLFFGVAGSLLALRSGLLPVRAVELTHPLGKTTRGEVEAALQGRLRGNFLSVRLDEPRAALEALPWVRRVVVRRVWPDRLAVTLEEHVPLARWGDDALVNTFGERFAAATDEPLPLFVAPAGTEGEVARRYRRFAELLGPLGTPPERVVLTPRFAWQLRLRGGLHVMLGRDADLAEARLARFVEAYPLTLGRMPRHHEYVDLRYPNGFALRIPDARG